MASNINPRFNSDGIHTEKRHVIGLNAQQLQQSSDDAVSNSDSSWFLPVLIIVALCIVVALFAVPGVSSIVHASWDAAMQSAMQTMPTIHP